jgi:hypothetical protein
VENWMSSVCAGSSVQETLVMSSMVLLKFCNHDWSKDNSTGSYSRASASSRSTMKNFEQKSPKFNIRTDLKD